ncbi:MAG: alpha/beta hydrolase [bacterium]|nr:alpha/beta hydrolase [bacterium]
MAKQQEHLDWVDLVRDHGVRSWAETTMRGRLGRNVPQAMFDCWIDLMSSANPAVLQRLFQPIATFDLTPKLSTILTPTLMITRAGSVLADSDTVKRWAEAIPNCRLHIVQSTSYHVAATDAGECATLSLDFLRQLAT